MQTVHDVIVRNIAAALPGSVAGTHPDVAVGTNLLVEVLSPTIRDIDSFFKWSEHKRMAGADYILMVESIEPLVLLWSREDGQWVEKGIRGLDAAVAMPNLKISPSMSAVYEGVQWETTPDKPTLSDMDPS
jgi:hypothetical protein